MDGSGDPGKNREKLLSVLGVKGLLHPSFVCICGVEVEGCRTRVGLILIRSNQESHILVNRASLVTLCKSTPNAFWKRFFVNKKKRNRRSYLIVHILGHHFRYRINDVLGRQCSHLFKLASASWQAQLLTQNNTKRAGFAHGDI